MSTFLELAQRVAQESGTVSGTLPTAVTAQTGHLKKIVDWTSLAWKDIQNKRSDWRFLRTDFTGPITSGSPRYTAASFSLTRFSHWVRDEDSMSIYLTATGASDENVIYEMPWEEWRKLYARGSGTLSANYNRPSSWSISPANELCFGPIPNASFTVRGEYYKSPQILSGNSDTPECPSAFHDAVVFRALMYLVQHDEAPLLLYEQVEMRYKEIVGALEKNQLPRLEIASAPLA